VQLLNKVAILSFACLALAACSGGGAAMPNLTKTANTNVPGYLPFGSGDEWTFSTGATITDKGSSILTGCACGLDGGTTVERMDLATSSGSYVGSLIYAKGTWALAPYARHALTYLVGLSEDQGNTVAPFFYSADLTVPGIPAIDDAPVANEAFTLPPPAGTGGGSLTIASVGGTQTLGAEKIINVAATTLVAVSPAGNSTTNFNYAPGVGFTYVVLASGPMTLSSFSLAGASAASIARNTTPANLRMSRPNNAHANNRTLAAMLEAWATSR
jgi:hypothetical protein